MLILPLTPSSIQKAIATLKKGGVVVYPTDTLYGMGVDATNDVAVKRVYEIKGRDFQKPLSIVVANPIMARRFVAMGVKGKALFDRLLPGAYTLVFPKKKSALSARLAQGVTGVGVRMPDDAVSVTLAKQMKKPITTTSANVSGEETPRSARAIYTMFQNRKEQPDIILDAGTLPSSKPSVIIDMSEKKPVIYRASVREIKILEKILYGS